MAVDVRAGVQGAVVGATMGAPHRGKTSFSRLRFYEPIPLRMSPSESLDAWWVWVSHVKSRRGPGALAASLTSQWSSVRDETAFGMANLASGLAPGASGGFRNPLADGSNAFGRSLFWGLAYHGSPDTAAEWGLADASIDHAEDGAWLPAMAAWILAAAQPGRNPRELVTAACEALPSRSRFLAALPHLLSLSGPDSLGELRGRLKQQLGISDEFHSVLTMAWACGALIAADGKFGLSVQLAAGCGGAADQAAMTAGSISALLEGQVPPDYLSPIGAAFIGTHALKGVDAPATIADVTNWVAQAHLELAPAPPAPAPPAMEPPAAEPPAAEPIPETAPAEASEANTEEPEAVSAAPEETVAAFEPAPMPGPNLLAHPGDSLRALLSVPGMTAVQELAGLRVGFQLIDPPAAAPGQAIRIAIAFTNTGAEDREVDAQLTPPDNWKHATRLTPFRLPVGETTTFPVVLQAPVDSLGAHPVLRVKVNMLEFKLPLFASAMWMAVGPFVNHEGTGFDKVYPAETTQKLNQIYNGRSELPVKWEKLWLPDFSLDLEPLFKNGPGTVVLWARVRFPRTGRMTMVAATSVGLVATIDGNRVLAYHDERQPVPRVREPYAASFETTGESTIILKVLRNRNPLTPGALYFLAEDGTVVTPSAWLPMDP